MASEFDEQLFNQQIDQITNKVTTSQSNALTAGITAYYKAGSDDVRPSTRLTNVQKQAIQKLTAQHFGYISEFNSAVGEQIKTHVQELLTQEKGYAEITAEIKEYAKNIFNGSETVTINNVGKTKTEYKVGKDGTIRAVEKVITRPYTTNVNAYSEMLSRTATHTAWEQGRTSEYERMGFDAWVFISSLDERNRPWHGALHGKVFTYGTKQSDMALEVMHEVNCRCRAIVYFGDSELDTPSSVFEQQKKDAGLYFDEAEKEWMFRD